MFWDLYIHLLDFNKWLYGLGGLKSKFLFSIFGTLHKCFESDCMELQFIGSYMNVFWIVYDLIGHHEFAYNV